MEQATATSDTGRMWRVEIATTRRERRRGLLGRATLDPGCALLLRRTRSVHTIGMRFAISVAWLDRDGTAVQVARLAPGRVSAPTWRSRDALECADGSAPAAGESLRFDAPRFEAPL